MKLGYTEFSFGYAFTENLIRSSAQVPTGAPQFPNLVQEAQLGYDVRIDLPACPIFFQFKLPELMVRDTAKEISVHRLQGLRCDFFRMSLMKRNLSHQHRHLIQLEQQHPRRVLYASPTMETATAFNRAYNQASVHLHSAMFSPTDIGPLPDDKQHVVSYRANGTVGWRCSRPQEVKVFPFDKVIASAQEAFHDPQFQRLEDVASRMVVELLEATPSSARIDVGAFRERVRSRLAPTILADGIGERHLVIIEQLLAAREIARIGLGLEMVIAQPRD